jgi:hypothetical protein
MNTWKQLLRNPVKTLLGLALLGLAGCVLCLGVGQYWAAQETRAQVEEDYTTIALLTDYYKTAETTDEYGNVIGMTYSSDQPFEVLQFLDELEAEHPEIIKSSSYNNFISAYSSQLQPLYPNQVDLSDSTGLEVDANNMISEEPYDTAIFAFTLDEIGEYDSDFHFWELVGTIEQVIALESGYPDPTGHSLEIHLYGTDPDTLDLQIGQTYLVYGHDYSDSDYELRQRIISSMKLQKIELTAEEIDWSKLVFLTEEEAEETGYKSLDSETGEEIYPVAFYPVTEDGAGCYLFEWELENANRSFIGCPEGLIVNIAALSGTVEEFLTSEEGSVWNDAIAEVEITNGSLPVITVSHLESMAQFARQETYISAGRSFTQEEYDQGAKVCVLSDTLALANGLSVGDTLNLSFYESSLNGAYIDMIKSANPTSSHYSINDGFAMEDQTYEIVGLYHQTDQWSEENYAFTPNTVFVPQNSITCRTETADAGIYKNIELYNGTIDQLQALAEAQGYDQLFVYYDQGYSEIQSNLTQFFSLSRLVLLAGVAAWLVVGALFLLLFPMMERRNVRRMWDLGATPSQIRAHVMCYGMGLSLPGVVLSLVLARALQNVVLPRLTASAGLEVTLEITPLWYALLALIQLVVSAVAVALCAAALLRRVKREAS